MFTQPSKFSSIQMPHRAKTCKPHDTGKQTATLFLLLDVIYFSYCLFQEENVNYKF